MEVVDSITVTKRVQKLTYKNWGLFKLRVIEVISKEEKCEIELSYSIFASLHCEWISLII